MISARPALAAACCVGALSCSAQAKQSTLMELKRTRAIVSSFSDCVVSRHAPLARWMILSNIDNEQILQDASDLQDGNCFVRATIGLGGNMRFSGPLFRYSIAGALVKNDYNNLQNFNFSDKSSLIHLAPAPVDSSLRGKKLKEAQEQFDKESHYSTISRFGECVVRLDATKVHRLLISEVNSVAETMAFHDLDEPMGYCLTEGKLSFGREILRGTLAVNFYRLAGAPAGASVATPKRVN